MTFRPAAAVLRRRTDEGADLTKLTVVTRDSVNIVTRYETSSVPTATLSDFGEEAALRSTETSSKRSDNPRALKSNTQQPPRVEPSSI